MTDTPAIYLDRVNRFYGQRPGVLDLSASVPAGTLVGLLGPNGAGKTTTIRILSCFMPPTSGTARICGFDVFSESVEVRKRIGYLPENCPLYPEMKVMEYLRWIAQMKGLDGSNVDRAIFGVVGPCGIDSVLERPISALSKGFRQRVGVASVLVHRPEVLILDEPTVGLDPLQVRELRSLLASLKGKHTVLLSSHILTEVEMLCDSVIILNEGRVVASGYPEDLKGKVSHTYQIQCKYHATLPTLLPRMVDRLPGLSLEKYEENSEYAHILLQGNGPDPRAELFRAFADAGIVIVEMYRRRITLEDVFVHFTKVGAVPEHQETPQSSESKVEVSS